MAEKYATCLHNTHVGHNKVYIARIDYVGGVRPFRVVAAWGRASNPKVQAEQIKDEFARLNDAQRLMSDLIEAKINGGYMNVLDQFYTGGLSRSYILGKVDMTRCYSDGQSVPDPARPQPTVRQSVVSPVVTSRASRLIQCGE